MLALASWGASVLVPQPPLQTRRSTISRCSAPAEHAAHTRLMGSAVLAGLATVTLPAVAWADSVTESATSAALQVPSSLLALDPEDQQLLLVLVFGSVVLVSPYLGIKMAQKGIEDANDILAPKDNKRNLKVRARVPPGSLAVLWCASQWHTAPLSKPPLVATLVLASFDCRVALLTAPKWTGERSRRWRSPQVPLATMKGRLLGSLVSSWPLVLLLSRSECSTSTFLLACVTFTDFTCFGQHTAWTSSMWT